MLGFLKKMFDFNERELRRLQPTLHAINAIEPEMEAKTDEELAAMTPAFRRRLNDGETMDDILIEAFAVVRETAKRILGQRHFDVQVLGALGLHRGMVCEMKTGEGKTLVATMPAYLNALGGKGVHVVTVNEYLARRDSEWMGEVYRFLGMEVGLIVSGLKSEERRSAYAADVTYGTNNEFGFDYLRDNMATSADRLVQRPLHYAIIDEVDSVLIDEARTPLIISGAPRKQADNYRIFAQIARFLKRDEHYTVDEEARNVVPTDEGLALVEKRLGIEDLFDPAHIELNHFLTQALKAKELMRRDRDYVVSDGRVVIVDQFTGRLMAGRRYSDGLHQSLEAKEGLEIREETQTLATITFQNFFRMYDKLAGMTGTAATEADEFAEIYDLKVIVIPTNRPMIRDDLPDAVYKSQRGKFGAVVEDIVQRHAEGQPLLVGTASIEKSEELSDMLRARGIEHEVLNAKHHEREAEIVKGAGEVGRVTIATNMAGRGTDIVLGEGVVELGGLHVLGTERHESRRIDNQLRGRSGRQGDPGSSQFYVSMEDDLMRLFGGEALEGMLNRIGLEESERLEHSMLSSAIERAQRRVEGKNFSIRKRLLEYDDVLNEQRKVIYEQRRRVLEGASMRDTILGMAEEVVRDRVQTYCSDGRYPEDWDLDGLISALEMHLLPPGRVPEDSAVDRAEKDGLEGMTDYLVEVTRAVYRAKEDKIGRERFDRLARVFLLRVVDSKWMDYLAAVDELRQGIGLRAYGQEKPLVAYQRETHAMFNNMIASIREDVVKYVYKLKVSADRGEPLASAISPVVKEAAKKEIGAFGAQVSGGSPGGSAGQSAPRTFERKGPKVGRNDPCPCGSGKKYKHCCGRF
ncbi:MAG: preprotein translocase subunit SecA [Clostridia bacterium]